jgi:predicted alpha/beta-hydrolase family hydrolase
MTERFQFDVDGEHLTATTYSAGKPLGSTLLLGHGVTGGQTSPFVVEYATGLARRGILVVTYDFPFMQHGRRTPDADEVLQACCRAAIVAARQCRPRNRLFIGGKSLGARIATEVAVAGGEEADQLAGVVALGYPLHPIGRPAASRARQLRQLRKPALFVQGTRDVFGTPDELQGILGDLPRGSRVDAVDGGDHSFSVTKRDPEFQSDVHAQIEEAIALWISEMGSGVAAAPNIPRARPVGSRVRAQLRALLRSVR